jgi:hypothetical protein
MRYVATPVSTALPTFPPTPFGMEFLRGYTCKYIAKFPLPKNYWEAIYNPNILAISSKGGYIKFFESYERSKARFESVSGVNIEGISIYTNFERAQYMFVTSVIFRMLQIISIDLLNKIDTKKWNIFGKMIVSAVVLAVPYLFMSYVLGFPMHDLIGPTQLQNLAAFGLNYFNSTAWSNTLRELNVVSTTRNFHFRDGIFRGFLSSAVNFVSTFLIQSYAFSTSTPMFIDDQTSISYCTRGPYAVQLMLSQKDAFFAEYITNELGWLAGRYAVDFSFAALNFLGVIKDLRTPFSVGQTSKPQVVAIPGKQEVVVAHAKQVRQVIQNPPGNLADLPDCATIPQNTGLNTYSHNTVETESRPNKVKTRPQGSSPVPAPAPAPAVAAEPRIIETSSGPMVLLRGDGVTSKTWAIVSVKRQEEQQLLEQSLRTGDAGHVGPGARIKTVGAAIFELRPARSDKRSVAEPVEAYRALREILPLGEAIEATRRIESDSEPKVVSFRHVVRHGSNIAREIASIYAGRRAREARVR